MFGLWKKNNANEEKNITLIKKTELNCFFEKYPIRYIFLTDLQNYKIDGLDLYLGMKDVKYWTSDTWAHFGEKLRITLYFLYENDFSDLGFQYGSISYVNNTWIFDETLKSIKFSDNDSEITYKNIEYEEVYSDGSKKNITERFVDEIILNRNNAPFSQGNIKL